MMAPMRRAAQLIEGDARFLQRLDDADMGEAARPAAGQHQAHGTPGNEARHPRHIGLMAGAQMMMGAEQSTAHREMIRQHSAGAVGMQQQQVRQAARRAP